VSFLVTSIGGLAASAALGDLARAQDAKSQAPTLPKLERRKLGKTDLTVGVLGFGGAEMGYAKTELDVVERMLLTALDQGLDAIDTAECYGISEEQIGATIAHRRDEFKLFTKVGHWPATAGRRRASAARSSAASSGLKTDHVEHRALALVRLDVLKKGEVIDALESARKAGKTRYIGYSGDSQAAKYAVETGRFDTLMTSISIADQEAIDLFLPKAREREMGVIVKRGIANAAWRYDSEPKQGYHVEYWKRLQALDYDFCRGERRADEGPEGAAASRCASRSVCPACTRAWSARPTPSASPPTARSSPPGPAAGAGRRDPQALEGSRQARLDRADLERAATYSMFCTCSRRRSIHVFSSTTRCATCASLHFEPTCSPRAGTPAPGSRAGGRRRRSWRAARRAARCGSTGASAPRSRRADLRAAPARARAPRRRRRAAVEQLAHALLQRLVVRAHDLRHALRDALHEACNGLGGTLEVALERRALALAHLTQRVERAVDRLCRRRASRSMRASSTSAPITPADPRAAPGRPSGRARARAPAARAFACRSARPRCRPAARATPRCSWP
jgi:hypothetical protein